jgi:hypothetical protein
MPDRNMLTREDYQLLQQLAHYQPPFSLEYLYQLHACRERWLSATIRKLLFHNLLLIEGLAVQVPSFNHSILGLYTYRLSDEGRRALSKNDGQ